jgi:hypothetical protein
MYAKPILMTSWRQFRFTFRESTSPLPDSARETAFSSCGNRAKARRRERDFAGLGRSSRSSVGGLLFKFMKKPCLATLDASYALLRHRARRSQQVEAGKSAATEMHPSVEFQSSSGFQLAGGKAMFQKLGKGTSNSTPISYL